MKPNFLLPYDSFVIETRTSVPELVQKLQGHIAPPGWYARPTHYRPFQGTADGTDFKIPSPAHPSPAIPKFQGIVDDAGFKITPIIRYKSSFLPDVHGRFEPGPDGTRVVVQVKLAPLVRVFLLVFVGFLGMGTLLSLCAFLDGQGPQVVCGPSGLALFAWLLASVFFWVEAWPARRVLEDLLGDH